MSALMPAREVKISSLHELKIWVAQIASQFSAQKLVLLNGPMSAGKTTFIHYLVEALGGKGVSSPTFTFHQTYKIKLGQLHHFDLYRASSEEDLESIGIWEHLTNSHELTLIEWAERLKIEGNSTFLKHKEILKIEIDIVDESTRIFKFKG
jgi:tRNA threonylcarbamoyladenosine biosynthesis protein TsaE